jgi:hypothetical protein
LSEEVLISSIFGPIFSNNCPKIEAFGGNIYIYECILIYIHTYTYTHIYGFLYVCTLKDEVDVALRGARERQQVMSPSTSPEPNWRPQSRGMRNNSDIDIQILFSQVDSPENKQLWTYHRNKTRQKWHVFKENNL